MTDPRFWQTKDKVQVWLLSWGWTVAQANADGVQWAILAKDSSPAPMGIHLLQPAGTPDRLVIQLQINTDEQTKERLLAMNHGERENFYWALRLQLLTMGPRFSGVEGGLDDVKLVREIALDGLTQNQLIRDLETIRDAALFIAWSVRRQLGQPAPQQPQAGPTIH